MRFRGSGDSDAIGGRARSFRGSSGDLIWVVIGVVCLIKGGTLLLARS